MSEPARAEAHRPFCGDPGRFRAGGVSDTPARRNDAALARRQQEAEALIQADPFVQEMIRDWGGKIVPGSIKSISP